jgi:Flp pilus assembly protein TadD
VAFIPANVLLSDPNSEWLKLGVPIVLQRDLMTAHSLISGYAPDEATATQGGATRVVRTSVENRQTRIHVDVTTVDAQSRKVLAVQSAEAPSVDALLGQLTALAKKFDPGATDFSTKNVRAWQSFSSAQGNENPQGRLQLLNQAISADADFGLAWVSLLQMITPNPQNDPHRLLDQVGAHRNNFSPYDRAKFDLAVAHLTSAPPAEQIKAAQRVLTLAPNDLDVLGVIGANQILTGDANAAEQSLRRAVALNPGNIGLRFQLARGLFQLRKYKDAEQLFTSMDKTPAVLPELATCLLLEGDKTRASQAADKFVASVQNPELKPVLQASWLVLSGDRQKGIDTLDHTQFTNSSLRSVALSQLSVWHAMGGNFAAAEKSVGLLSQAPGQAVQLHAVASMLVDKSTPSPEWQKKIEAAGMPEAIKQPVLGYGAFLRGDYTDAVTAWQRIYDRSHTADLHARAMLAASLDRAGKHADAQRITVIPFAPEFADLYSAISFTEMRRMLGR